MKKLNFTVQNIHNCSTKNLIVMKKNHLFSKIAGILLLLVALTLNAIGGTPQTPYSQLQSILKTHHINKETVTDELTRTEIRAISYDVASQFKVQEYTFKYSKTVGELLTSILQSKYDGKRGSEWEWRKIQYSSNFYDYVVYLCDYPKTKHYEEALSKQIVTYLYAAWLRVDILRKTSVQTFLSMNNLYSHMYNVKVRKYDCNDCDIPCLDYEGFSLINVREMVDAVQEQRQSYEKELQAWKDALREDTHDAYWNYYLQYPQGRFADTAISKVTVLEKSSWEKAQESDSREGYEAFVKEFPQGFYSSEAYNKIVRSHLDTTSSKSVDQVIAELCEYERPGYSLIGIGNVNNKNKTYTVTFTGKSGYRLTLLPGEYKWLEIEDGDYKILVEADDVKPWWCFNSCHGHLYAAAWFVKDEYEIKTPNLSHKLNDLYSRIIQSKKAVKSGIKESESMDNNPNVDQAAKKRFIDSILNQCNSK